MMKAFAHTAPSRRALVAFAACLVGLSGLLLVWGAQRAEASSQYVEWKVFQASSGALLTVHFVFSGLSGDEPSRRLLMTANCDPTQPMPYLVTVINRLNVRDAPPVAELHWSVGDGYTAFAPGAVLDRVAIANAGRDSFARYGVEFNPNDRVWDLFATNGRSGVTFRLVGGRSGQALSSPPLAAETQRDRRAINGFLEACRGFLRQAGLGAVVDQRSAGTSACQQRLEESADYGQDIADVVCGGRPNDVNPANCMSYVMSGEVAWDQQGSNQWQPMNAANLCRSSQNTAQTVACFSGLIDRGFGWRAAIDRCRAPG